MVKSNPDAYARRLRDRFIRRAIETTAPLLAPQLQRYADAEGMSWTELAHSLDCSVDALNQIAICRPPRADRFVADTKAIAADYVDPDLLLPLLRRLQVLEAFAGRTAPASAVPNTDANDALLLAARDHDEGELHTSETSSNRSHTEAPAMQQDDSEGKNA